MPAPDEPQYPRMRDWRFQQLRVEGGSIVVAVLSRYVLAQKSIIAILGHHNHMKYRVKICDILKLFKCFVFNIFKYEPE